MKRLILLSLVFTMAIVVSLPAQENHLPEWDFGTLFDEPLLPPAEQEPTVEVPIITVVDLLRLRGFTLTIASTFRAGIAPGFHESPWRWDSFADREHYFLERVFLMRTQFTVDSQINANLRFRSRVFFEIPNFGFRFGDMWFDYNFHDRVFVRGGIFNMAWGISRNFHFANLLAYIPPDLPAQAATINRPAVTAAQARTFNRDPFIFRADIPFGVGGFQLLALTRAPLTGNIKATGITMDDIAYGGRYSVAFREIDLSMGMLNQNGMPFRLFMSASTSFWDTDWYTEGVLAISDTQPRLSSAMNLGFTRVIDFFGSLSINGELFINGLEETRFRQPGTALLEDGYVTSFIRGLNIALNLHYRFPDRGRNPQLILQWRHAPFENTGRLVPSFRINPWPNIVLDFAMPMALGSRHGYYHQHTVRMDTIDPDRRNIPFSLMMLVTISGNVRLDHRY